MNPRDDLARSWTAAPVPPTARSWPVSGLQHLLSRAVWDADGVRDDLLGYVTDHLGHDAVLAVDETGDGRQGRRTPSPARMLDDADLTHQIAGTTLIVDEDYYVGRAVARRQGGGVHGVMAGMLQEPASRAGSWASTRNFTQRRAEPPGRRPP